MNARHSRLAFAAAFAAFLLARASDANAPAGHYTIGTGAAAGTVHDTKSGLTWQQTLAASPSTWANATTYCAALNLNGTGWRLPTAKELYSLVDRSQTAPPLIDSTAFPGTPAVILWSSTLKAGSPSSAWYVNFGSGGTAFTDVSFAFYYARCVR